MITRALSFDHTIFPEDTNYMTILTRQEREGLELELDNHDETYREISKVARIAACDIDIILNKIIEEKAEESKEDKIIFSPRTLIKNTNNTYS